MSTEHNYVGHYVQRYPEDTDGYVRTDASVQLREADAAHANDLLARLEDHLPSGPTTPGALGPPRGGWILVRVEYCGPTAVDTCPRCGDHRLACGGPAASHE